MKGNVEELKENRFYLGNELAARKEIFLVFNVVFCTYTTSAQVRIHTYLIDRKKRDSEKESERERDSALERRGEKSKQILFFQQIDLFYKTTCCMFSATQERKTDIYNTTTNTQNKREQEGKREREREESCFYTFYVMPRRETSKNIFSRRSIKLIMLRI